MSGPISAAAYFGSLPYVEASAPGRVNLLGTGSPEQIDGRRFSPGGCLRQ